MVRKLKFHEKKLLKKVDFISWELDNNIHEATILRRYYIKNRQHYSMYNTLAVNVSLIYKVLLSYFLVKVSWHGNVEFIGCIVCFSLFVPERTLVRYKGIIYCSFWATVSGILSP